MARPSPDRGKHGLGLCWFSAVGWVGADPQSEDQDAEGAAELHRPETRGERRVSGPGHAVEAEGARRLPGTNTCWRRGPG